MEEHVLCEAAIRARVALSGAQGRGEAKQDFPIKRTVIKLNR